MVLPRRGPSAIKVGDQVEATYTEGIAISMTPPARRQAGTFSVDETADVGIHLGTPVVEVICAEAK